MDESGAHANTIVGTADEMSKAQHHVNLVKYVRSRCTSTLSKLHGTVHHCTYAITVTVKENPCSAYIHTVKTVYSGHCVRQSPLIKAASLPGP